MIFIAIGNILIHYKDSHLDGYVLLPSAGIGADGYHLRRSHASGRPSGRPSICLSLSVPNDDHTDL